MQWVNVGPDVGGVHNASAVPLAQLTIQKFALPATFPSSYIPNFYLSIYDSYSSKNGTQELD